MIATLPCPPPRWMLLDAKREETYHRLKTGLSDAGEDRELQEYIAPDAIKGLPLLGQFRSSSARTFPVSYSLFSLPDGDRLERSNHAKFCRWTNRPDVLARAEVRRRVRAHLYALPLADALATLERAAVGGGRFTWLGGTWGLAAFTNDGRLVRDPGSRLVLTAREQTEHLRSLLLSRCDLPCMSPEDKRLIIAALDLLDENAIKDEL